MHHLTPVVLTLALAGAVSCDARETKRASTPVASEPAEAADKAAADEEPAPTPPEPPTPLPPAPPPPEPLDDAAKAAHEQVLAHLGPGFEIHALGSRRFIASDGLDITTGHERYELEGENVMGISGEQRVLALDSSRRARALTPKAPREELHAAVLDHLGGGYSLAKRGATTILAQGDAELTKAHVFWVHEGEVWAKLGATRWLVIDRDQQVHDPVEPSAKLEGVRKPMPLKLSVSSEGCTIMGGELRDCAKLCEDAAAFEGADAAIIEAGDDAKAQLSTLLACLGTKQIAASVRGPQADTPE